MRLGCAKKRQQGYLKSYRPIAPPVSSPEAMISRVIQSTINPTPIRHPVIPLESIL